jgi:hypothetical protein
VTLILHVAADTSAVAHGKPLELFDTIVMGAHRVLGLAVQHDARVLLRGSGHNTVFCRALLTRILASLKHLRAHASAAVRTVLTAKRTQETLAVIYVCATRWSACNDDVLFRFFGPACHSMRIL